MFFGQVEIHSHLSNNSHTEGCGTGQRVGDFQAEQRLDSLDAMSVLLLSCKAILGKFKGQHNAFDARCPRIRRDSP